MASVRSVHVVVLAILVAIAAAVTLRTISGKENETVLRRPDGAGPVPNNCEVLRNSIDPDWGQVSTHEATWSLSLRDEERDKSVGDIHLAWIYWVTEGGDVHGMQACWRADGVPDDLAVSVDVHMFNYQPTGERARFMLDTFVTVIGSAEVDESRGPQPHHATASLRRLFITGPEGVDVQESSGFEEVFEPPAEGGNRRVSVEDHGVEVRKHESPYE